MQDYVSNFEPTRSFAYRFVRYTVLPEVEKEVVMLGDEPFLLREIAWPVIDRLLTKEQQVVRVPRAQSEGDDSMSSIVRFYVNFLAKELDHYESLGKGYFRALTVEDIPEDELVDAAMEDFKVSRNGHELYRIYKAYCAANTYQAFGNEVLREETEGIEGRADPEGWETLLRRGVCQSRRGWDWRRALLRSAHSVG